MLGQYAGNSQEGEGVIQPLRELAKPLVDGTSVTPCVALQKKLDARTLSHVPVYGDIPLFFPP
ncbi:hypothetical protein GCM10011391_13480 [Pullulanibacillus camelliae]|uniref:Uncharacterized protein n=1 Tax=Pullulanibacillus camelliae TaxID=1707096 RepID=A0A8J2VNN0_9BACL|nr:hypothetical protein GCM10011391_13480 [Pullulanibacillus camelliae]